MNHQMSNHFSNSKVNYDNHYNIELKTLSHQSVIKYNYKIIIEYFHSKNDSLDYIRSVCV